MKTEAAIGLGTNLGDRLGHLREAMRRLCEIPGARLLCKSSVYETDPVDVPEAFADMKFLNAVAIFEVEEDVEAWSREVHAIEDAMRRIRGAVPNMPRTIDLDLLYFGNCVMDRPHLRLPHPQCAARRFVCQPLAELRPGLVLPGAKSTIAQMLAALPETPRVVLRADTW